MKYNLDSYITQNFKWKEFFKSQTAKRKGIDNIPTDDNIWENLEELVVNVLQPLRDEFGCIRITSGYRSPELNSAIGGSENSNHCFGFAADIEPLKENVSLMDVIVYIHNILDFRELIVEYFPDGWIHVAYRKGSNARQLKLKDDNHNYQRVSLEYIKQLYGGSRWD